MAKQKKKNARQSYKSGIALRPIKKKGAKKKKRYAHNTHDPYEALRRYKANHLDEYSFNKAQTIHIYTTKGKTPVRLIPATWGMVFAYAFLNAFAVFGVRIIWVSYFGRPADDFITPSSEVVLIEDHDKSISVPQESEEGPSYR